MLLELSGENDVKDKIFDENGNASLDNGNSFGKRF